MKDNHEGRSIVTPLVSRAAIREQAAQWLVRVDGGQLTSDDLAEFRRWASTSQYHRMALRELANDWDQMDILAELAELFPISADATSKTQSRVFNRRPVIGLALAAMLVLGIVASLRTLEPTPPKPTIATTTPSNVLEVNSLTGEQRDVTLNDGSIIRLNTKSSVRVDYTLGRRHVILRQGEASFEVAKDAARPFVVDTGFGMIEAVGTAFNVELDGEDIEVTVTEGKVKIYGYESRGITPKNPAKNLPPVLLEAGRSIRIGKGIGEVEQVAASDLERKLAWQQGSLIFKGETLEQALAEVSRYTDQDLVIVDPTIRDLLIGGHFKTTDVDGLLDTLGKSFDLTITPQNGQRILVGRK